MTVYYMQNQLADYAQKSKVKAFQPVSAESEANLAQADITAGLPYAYRISAGRHEAGGRQVPAAYLHLPARYEHSLP